MLGEVPDIELKREVVTPERVKAWTTMTTNSTGVDVPASIIRWNAGWQSLVVVAAPASMKISANA